MTVWHICNLDVFEIFEKQRFLNCGTLNNKLFHDPDGGSCQTIKDCYDYMSYRLLKKCPEKPAHALDYPVWVWYKYACDSNKRMPPLKSEDNPDINDQVRITLDIPDNLVLLSDYNLWHIPLNNGFICNSKEDDEYLTNNVYQNILENRYPMTLERFRELNWELLFQLDRFLCPYWHGRLVNEPDCYGRSIQGVTWVLYWKYVRKVDILKNVPVLGLSE